MHEIFISAGFGIMGGAVRTLIGFLKTVQVKHKVKPSSLAVYGVILIIIGAFSGIVLGYGKVLSFLGGYAGIDLIASYYKTFVKRKVRI